MKRPVTVVKGQSALALVAALASALALSVGARPALAENRLFVAAGDGTQTPGPYEGLATEAGLFGLGGDIAPTRAGGFLFSVTAEGSMVLRVNAKGRISRLAGGTKYGFRGDGGPAAKALMNWVHDIAVTGGGGFLVVDSCRVRAVGRDGIIRTVAGSGPPMDCSLPDSAGPAPGDGGPATAALLRDPLAVASLPGDGFLVAEGNRVRRVARDGKISTVAGTGAASEFGDPEFGRATAARLLQPRLLAPLTGGGFLVTDANGVHRVRPDGIIVPVGGSATIYSENGVLHPSAGFPGRVSGERPGYFGGYGDLASSVPFAEFEDIEPAADGGLLLAGELQVFFIAPPRTTRLGIAVARETLPALLRRRVRFRLTRAARVKMKLYRGRRVVARRTVSGAAGLNTLQLPRRTEPGLRYLKVRALAPDGSVATNALRVLVGPWLPKKVAVWESIAEYGCFGECGGIEDTVEKCRRFGPRRVDCVMGDIDLDTYERDRCTRVVSSVLRRSGYLYIRPYGCRKRNRFGYFRGRPSYTGAAKQGRPL